MASNLNSYSNAHHVPGHFHNPSQFHGSGPSGSSVMQPTSSYEYTPNVSLYAWSNIVLGLLRFRSVLLGPSTTPRPGKKPKRPSPINYIPSLTTQVQPATPQWNRATRYLFQCQIAGRLLMTKFRTLPKLMLSPNVDWKRNPDHLDRLIANDKKLLRPRMN